MNFLMTAWVQAEWLAKPAKIMTPRCKETRCDGPLKASRRRVSILYERTLNDDCTAALRWGLLMSEEATKFDTAQIKAIVEAALKSALEDRPTKAEVQVMISQSVTASIDGLRNEIRAERTEQNRQMETTLAAQIDRLAGLVTVLSDSVRDHRKQIDDDLKRVDEQIASIRGETLSLDVRMDSTTLLATNTYRAVFGHEGDGPESLFKMLRDLRGDMQKLFEKMDARVSILEVNDAFRTNIENTVLGALRFMKSRNGIVLMMAILTFLLALAGKDDVVRYWITPFLNSLNGAP